MPRTFTFTPTDQDQIFAITVIRDELTVVNVSDGNTKLQLSISTTRGGSPIIQIPSTGGKFDLRPSLLESLDEGMTYQHNIWDYSNSVDGKRIATGTFTHAESIKSVDIAYPTVTLADGTLRIFVTQAQFDSIAPKDASAEYVIVDASGEPVPEELVVGIIAAVSETVQSGGVAQIQLAGAVSGGTPPYTYSAQTPYSTDGSLLLILLDTAIDAEVPFIVTDSGGQTVSGLVSVVVFEQTVDLVGQAFRVTGFETGYDATGYGQYIVVPSGEALLAGLSSDLDGSGNLISGLMLNPARSDGNAQYDTQGFDARITGAFNAGLTVAAPVSVTAGDILMKATSADPEVGDDGYLDAIKPLWVVPAPLAAGDVLPSAVGWPGRPAPAPLAIDLAARFALLQTADMSALSGLPSYADVRDHLIRYPAFFAGASHTMHSRGYENFVPNGFNRVAGRGYDLDNSNILCEAGIILASSGVYTEAERFDIYKLVLRIGLDCAMPVIESGAPLFVDGGHAQSLIYPAALALHALGREAEIEDLQETLNGSLTQYFLITPEIAAAQFVPHDNTGFSCVYRRRTLPDQAGLTATQVKIPTQYGGPGNIMGDWYQTQIAVGSKIRRESDGAEATVTVSVDFPNAPAGTITLGIGAQPSPAFAASDIIHFTFPENTGVVGEWAWALRGQTRPNYYTGSAENGYTELRKEGAHLHIMSILGLLPPSFEGFFDFCRKTVQLAPWPAANNALKSHFGAWPILSLLPPMAAAPALPGVTLTPFYETNDFVTGWDPRNLTVTQDSVDAPSWGVRGARLEVSVATATPRIRRTVNQTVSTDTEVGIFAKSGTGSYILLRNHAVAGAPGAWFDMGSGAVSTVEAGLAATIENVGDGWYFCKIRGVTSDPIANPLIEISVPLNGNTTSGSIGRTVFVSDLVAAK